VLVDLAAGRAPEGPLAPGPELVASAVDHGMQGLLWSWVRDHAPEFPDRHGLAGLDLATRQRHERLFTALAEVRVRLDAVGVTVVACKGVTAEARWFARVGERPCTDVDVLVEPGAAGRAAVILDALAPGHPLRPEIDGLVRSGAMQSVNVVVDGVAVDVHFDLWKLGFPLRRRDEVWERTVPWSLPDGSTVRVLDPAVALVHLLVHANKDGFPRLLGYADVARVLRDDDLDPALVEHLARAEGLEVVVGCALATVTRALALDPGPVRGAVPRGPRVAVWRWVWPEPVTLLGSSGTQRSRRQEVLPFLVRGRAVEAGRAAARTLVPDRANVALRYADVPGPYLSKLTRGRIRTAGARRKALRARRSAATVPPTGRAGVDAGPAPRDPLAIAQLLRRRVDAAPLWLTVDGSSMGWSIRGGTAVLVAPAVAPRPGEVWAFCDDTGTVVVHRARGRSARGGYRFQGDACVRGEDHVGVDRLVGQVVRLDPPRAGIVWGPVAGALQRWPRVGVATLARAARAAGPARWGSQP